MDTSHLITGQVFFRQAGSTKRELNVGERQLWMFVGIVAIPPDVPLQTEHQYTLVGRFDSDFLSTIALEIPTVTAHDLSKQTRGNTIGDLVLMPIWRV